jgi:hypothetical protein
LCPPLPFLKPAHTHTNTHTHTHTRTRTRTHTTTDTHTHKNTHYTWCLRSSSACGKPIGCRRDGQLECDLFPLIFARLTYRSRRRVKIAPPTHPLPPPPNAELHRAGPCAHPARSNTLRNGTRRKKQKALTGSLMMYTHTHTLTRTLTQTPLQSPNIHTTQCAFFYENLRR